MNQIRRQSAEFSTPLAPLAAAAARTAQHWLFQCLAAISGSILFLAWIMISLVIAVLGTVIYAVAAIVVLCFTYLGVGL